MQFAIQAAGSLSRDVRAPCLLSWRPSYFPFWAHRAHRIGVATKPLPVKKCTAEALGERLRTALSSDEIRQKASEISSLVREEGGVMTAVEKIERIHESYHA